MPAATDVVRIELLESSSEYFMFQYTIGVNGLCVGVSLDLVLRIQFLLVTIRGDYFRILFFLCLM